MQKTSSNLCAFFPKERMPSRLWSNILNERFLYFTSPLTATVADASMPLCVLGPEIKLNNQCHTLVCMVPNIFQHDHPTNSPDGRCKAYYLEGSFSMLQVTSGLSQTLAYKVRVPTPSNPNDPIWQYMTDDGSNFGCEQPHPVTESPTNSSQVEKSCSMLPAV